MSRDIKFRSWDAKTQTMNARPVIYGGVWYESLEHFDRDISNVDVPKGKSLMQYTGLKDKNGVEIYEGDICTWFVNDHDVTGEVYYTDQSFDLRSPKRGSIGWDSYRGEVLAIGNIHENPELLQGEKL
jgi:hypothetical protein